MTARETMPPGDAAALYTGRFRHMVDRSRRVALPARWRPAGSPSTFVVVQWPVGRDEHLLVLTCERWQEVEANLRQQSLSNQKTAALIRQLGSTHARVSLDKVGRLPLPEQQARSAGIEADAELFGLLDRFEIWSPGRYATIEAENKRLAAEAFEMTTL